MISLKKAKDYVYMLTSSHLFHVRHTTKSENMTAGRQTIMLYELGQYMVQEVQADIVSHNNMETETTDRTVSLYCFNEAQLVEIVATAVNQALVEKGYEQPVQIKPPRVRG